MPSTTAIAVSCHDSTSGWPATAIATAEAMLAKMPPSSTAVSESPRFSIRMAMVKIAKNMAQMSPATLPMTLPAESPS